MIYMKDRILITGFSHTFSPQQTADCQYTINLRYWRAHRGEISCEIQVHMKFPPIKICLLCGGRGKFHVKYKKHNLR